MSSMPGSTLPLALIGNWDRHKKPPGNGFGVCRLDPASGRLELLTLSFRDITVGAACLHPTLPILYCVDEYTTLPGYFLGGGGQAYALRIDAGNGELTEINHCPSYGSLPSFVCVDTSGSYLLITHHTDRVPVTKVTTDPAGTYRIGLEYDDATTVLFRLREDGSISEPADVYTHSGDGGPLRRQTHPQLHSVNMSPSGKLFVVTDKGNDELVVFTINRQQHKLEAVETGFKLAPGSSPRYAAFHPTRPFLFVNHETTAIVSTLAYQESGLVRLVCTTSCLPEADADQPHIKQSDIRIHPSGKYLYSLIRGLDAVTVFEINQETGMLRRIQTVPLDGLGPRGCAVTPDGRFLHIAALDSHEVLTWAINQDGTLIPTGQTMPNPNPGTVTFFPAH